MVMSHRVEVQGLSGALPAFSRELQSELNALWHDARCIMPPGTGGRSGRIPYLFFRRNHGVHKGLLAMSIWEYIDTQPQLYALKNYHGDDFLLTFTTFTNTLS